MSEKTSEPSSRGRATNERRRGAGGRRLAEAFEAVTSVPALAEAHRGLLGAGERETSGPAELTEAVESDAALTIAVMRAANNGNGPAGRAGGVRDAVEELDAQGVME